MFIGEYTHNLDAKRRIAIPAKFRKELGESAVLTRGLDNCLFIFPKIQWEQLAEKLSFLPIGQQGTRAFIRLLMSGAVEVEFDVLGRILIPDYLKKYADLKKGVVVTGVLNRLEIWDEEKWNGYRANLEKNSDSIAEKLGELGMI
ncbi:MAG: cell division/cell wall cluster transcriptional repressor MraZ [Candidatus Yanofskybacteria bacterium RIFCSPHIGHO2_01_FULL_44_22]|uniref:Transcriptional regulator MraZ n=1 Tax=Candidatus Yanofskybacteria bacterium RIFCSPHIGHO2_01_FULL_44_22 TaxID=1802669 RepID=A0A1F8ETJ5_9BACT|nr:MAG: cell division/cell wall cluster transcriptional repressor MraZ [Candidatus Yanofskybacteria bacterium RIFCSPHIGHO2_01_FULL_44_22]